jgi:competence ComEA-like helix-hairpin-helix protein
VEPRVPETRAARAVLCALLLLCAARPGLGPAPAREPLVLVREGAAGTCRLADASVSGPRCGCEEMPVDVRRTLGLPTSLNRARAAELERVPGLGPVRAAAIAAERARGGSFDSVEALARRVPGIGARTVDRIRPHLFAVGPDPACGVEFPS